jgi:hypothetical protein
MGLKEGIYETCPHCRQLVFLIKEAKWIVRGDCICGATLANTISPMAKTTWGWVLDSDPNKEK